MDNETKEYIKRKGENTWDQTWQNMRKRGAVTCHGHAIPKECPNNLCNSYPWTELCETCNPCSCRHFRYNKIMLI